MLGLSTAVAILATSQSDDPALATVWTRPSVPLDSSVESSASGVNCAETFGKPDSCVTSTPVQVYILMGQSNMLGEGKVHGAQNGSLEFAVHTEHKYPYLLDPTGNWSVSKTVRNVAVMGSGGPDAKVTLHHNEFMTAGIGATIGPEFGIGFTLANATTDPIMTLKSCIGNRALGWDLLPPGSASFDYTDPRNASEIWTYAGYHQSPNRWLKGSTPVPIGWEAGIQYDGDTQRVR
jgi:hypothetical protein